MKFEGLNLSGAERRSTGVLRIDADAAADAI